MILLVELCWRGKKNEWLVWALAGSFPPANSTCIVVVLFIVWKFLWFFFLMCSTHQPHWANKGKRMFQIYFCSSYLSEPNGWHVSQIGTHLIIIRFPLGLFPFSWLFCIHGCALAPGTSWVFPSLFRVWKAGVMISLMKVKRWKVTWGFIKWLHSMCACSPRTYIPLRVSNCLEGYQVDI